jgi:regulator of sigma E protease
VLKPDPALGAPTIGVTSPVSLTVPAAVADKLPGAARRAEPALQGGDTIKAVNGAALATYAELIAALSRERDKPVTLTVSRTPAAPAGATPATVEVQLPPQRRLTTGLTMTARDVKAVQEGSPASAAGIRAGDRLLTIDGESPGDPLTIDDRLRGRVGRPVSLALGHDGEEDRVVEVIPREVTWQDDDATGKGTPAAVAALGLALTVDSLVAGADGPAAAAGIAAGERIVHAWFVEDGKPVGAGLEISEQEPNWPVVVDLLQQADPGTGLRLTVRADGGEERTVDLVPAEAQDLFVVDRGLVFEPLTTLVRAGSIGDAVGRGTRKTVEDLSLVYGFLGKLWTNDIDPRLVGGPIEIAKQAGRHAQEGFSRLLLFLTMLSANLAVVNFLPIPVLDGGHMVFLAYELVRGKPPSEGVVAVLSYLGLALILTLMLFVFGLDLGLIPRR